MRKQIRKRIRREGDGVNVAADVDAAISITTGKGERNVVRSSSQSTVVQRPAGKDPDPKEEQ
jgi:hypothetical protein